MKQSSSVVLAFMALFAMISPGASTLEIPVSGRVRTPDGSPLAGARVELAALLDGAQAGKLELEGKVEAAPAATAVADEKGFFRVAAPEPGLWRIVIRAPGRIAMENRLIPLLEETDLPPVELAADQGLSVHVLDRNGKAIPRARVRALAGEAYPWRPVRRLAWTDDQGLARLPWAAGEKVWLRAFAAGALESGQSVVKRSEATLTLDAARSLPVELVDAAGKPLAAVLASVGKDVWPVGLTDAQGRVILPVPVGAPLDLTVQVRQGWRETVELRLTAEDLAIPDAVKRIQLSRPAVITGRVLRLPERVPFPGALVWLTADPAAAVRSDAGGAYALTNSQPGPGSVLAAAPEYRLAGAAFEVAPELLGEGALQDVELSPAGVVEGRVVDSEGRPLQETEVKASLGPEEARDLPVSPASTGETWTSAEGRFRVGGLLPGKKYDLTARKEGFAPASVVVVPAPARSVVPTEVVLKKGRLLTGRIVDAEGRPVGGVRVEVSQGIKKDVQTRETGTFELLDLPGGTYDLSFYRQGFSPLVVPRVDFPQDKDVIDLGTLTLRKAGMLEGRVTDPKGNPITGVQIITMAMVAVVLEHASPEDRKGQGYAVTDAEGHFRVQGLLPGERVEVFIKHPGYLARTLHVQEGRPVEIVLRPGAGISGSVVDDQGEPVSGAKVKILRDPTAAQQRRAEWSPSWEPTAFTDTSGRFHLNDLEPGTARLITVKEEVGIADFGEVVLESGKELRDVVITLPREAAPTIEGRVLDAQGRPVAGAEVAVFPGAPFPPSSRATTDASGRFRIAGILPGPSTVSAVDPVDLAETSQQIQVKRGRNELDLILESGQRVSGWVRDETGQPISGVTVWLESLPDRTSMARKGLSAADGAFSLSRVPDGQYQVHAWSETAGSPWVRVAVAGSPVEGVQLRLQRSGRITGRILGARPEDVLWLRVMASRGEPPEVRTGQIDHEGRYTISSSLLPGPWEVVAWDERTGRTARGSVNLQPGSPEAVLNLGFHGDGDLALSGRVLRHAEPISDLQVRLIGSRSSTVWMTTDSFGGFRLEGLAAGSYRLEVCDSTGKTIHQQPVELTRNEEIVVSIE